MNMIPVQYGDIYFHAPKYYIIIYSKYRVVVNYM